MSNGKIAAQCSCAPTVGSSADRCSHATLSCYKAVSKANPALLRAWEREGCVSRSCRARLIPLRQAKIALQCKSEDDMLLLQVRSQLRAALR